MSDAMTAVEPAKGQHYLCRGHKSREAAIEEARRALDYEADRALQALFAIDAGHVRVFHQRGVYVPTHRRELAALASTEEPAPTEPKTERLELRRDCPYCEPEAER